MNSERKMVFDKYGGKCAYCGCELKKGWHIDHIEPVRRWQNEDWNTEKRKYVVTEKGFYHPERHCLDNMMPACASCNICKGGNTIQGFRNDVANFINSLNSYTSIYRIVKRFGLIEETNKKVVFYFETLNSPNHDKD